MADVRRKIIYTAEPFITKDNVLDVLREALPKHQFNANRIKFLFDFEGGNQPLIRHKQYRPEIDIHAVDNVAHQATKFHVGYEWGNPITLVQRGNESNTDITEALSELNWMYECEGIKTKTQRLGKDVTVCDLGYTHIGINKEWQLDDSYFTMNVLSPYTTFLIKSSYYIDHRVMMGVTYMVDDMHVKHFTCYTKDTRYDITEDKIVYAETNPLGRVPIIEWIGNYDGMGIWEHEISEMDNLNLMISDFSNNVEQNMQAIWHTNDIEFDVEVTTDEDGNETETTIKPSNGDFFQTFTLPDGKTPIIEPLTINHDYASQLNNINARRSLILEKCYVPQRTDGTNSTGVAQDVASGYSSLDIVAESIQACQEAAKMEEVKCVLAAIRVSTDVPPDSPLLKLRVKDIQPSVKRERLSELATKVNAFATLVSHGIYGLDALQVINAFPDTNQTWENSREGIEAYQMSVFGENTDSQNEAVGGMGEKEPDASRIMTDLSDQVENTPLLVT